VHELDAGKGAVATSYAEIAQRAGVSLPTLYKHFPTQDQLIAACTGHVAGQGPALSAAQILEAATLAAAAEALVASDRCCSTRGRRKCSLSCGADPESHPGSDLRYMRSHITTSSHLAWKMANGWTWDGTSWCGSPRLTCRMAGSAAIS
jgi:AcrR family transcriptional regulator